MRASMDPASKRGIAWDPSVTATVQQVQQARQEAIEMVESLLQSPQDLSRLSWLLSDYQMRLQSNQDQLALSLESQVEAPRTGMRLVLEAQKELVDLRTCFSDIDKLCADSAALVDHTEKIQLINNTQVNLKRTLAEVQDVVAMPEDAEAVDRMLAQPEMLLDAYENLVVLTVTAGIAQKAMVRGNARIDDVHKLSQYFDKVKEVEDKFEDILWDVFSRFSEVSREDPNVMVSATRVVELQDMLETQLKEQLVGKGYKARCFEVITQAIQDQFEPLMDKSKGLAAVGGGRTLPTASAPPADATATSTMDGQVEEILDDAETMTQQVVEIYDSVQYCFPARYNIFKVCARAYHLAFDHLLNELGRRAPSLSNAHTLDIIQWSFQYQDTMVGLGLNDNEVQWPEKRGPAGGMLAGLFDAGQAAGYSDLSLGNNGLDALAGVYLSRTKEALTTWYQKLLEVDLKGKPKQLDNGMLWTLGVTDFFRLINDQLSVITQVSKGALLMGVAVLLAEVMRGYQGSLGSILERPLSMEQLAATVNNNLMSYEQASTLQDNLQDTLLEDFQPQLPELQIGHICRGFLGVAKQALEQLVSRIFDDPGVVELHKQVYHVPGWLAGDVTATWLATLTDYFQDLATWLDPSFFRRAAQRCLERTCTVWKRQLVEKVPKLTEEVLERMADDEEQVSRFFQKHLPHAKVAAASQQLADLRELAGAEDPESFVLAFSSIFQTDPNVTPDLVAKVCHARSDITRRDAAEVMEQCRQVYEEATEVRRQAAAERGDADASDSDADDADGVAPPASGQGQLADLLGRASQAGADIATRIYAFGGRMLGGEEPSPSQDTPARTAP